MTDTLAAVGRDGYRTTGGIWGMNTSLAQKVMPIVGAFYVLIGIVGFFVTGFDGFDTF